MSRCLKLQAQITQNGEKFAPQSTYSHEEKSRTRLEGRFSKIVDILSIWPLPCPRIDVGASGNTLSEPCATLSPHDSLQNSNGDRHRRRQDWLLGKSARNPMAISPNSHGTNMKTWKERMEGEGKEGGMPYTEALRCVMSVSRQYNYSSEFWPRLYLFRHFFILGVWPNLRKVRSPNLVLLTSQ